MYVRLPAPQLRFLSSCWLRPGHAAAALAVIVLPVAPADAGEDDVRWPPKPPAASERSAERHAMVRRQIAVPPDHRLAVTDRAVLEAMRGVPRHVFVPPPMRRLAYRDTPLKIGHGPTISQPYIVAIMTQLLSLIPESKVLEIGTGSAYQAAVLAHLTQHVYSVEIIKPLAERGRQTLIEQGYETVQLRQGDGYRGWAEHGSFDAIIVTCAAGHIPPQLWQQLKPGGRIVIPIGGIYETQRLVVVTKTAEGKRHSRSVMTVRFVPMTGAH